MGKLSRPLSCVCFLLAERNSLLSELSQGPVRFIGAVGTSQNETWQSDDTRARSKSDSLLLLPLDDLTDLDDPRWNQ